MKKAFLIILGIGTAASAAVLAYTYWWATHGFDNQEMQK